MRRLWLALRLAAALLLAPSFCFAQAFLPSSPPAAIPATDAFAACLASAPAGTWIDLSTCANSGAATLRSIVWACAATPCPGAPATAPTAADVAGDQGPQSIMTNWAGGVYDSDGKRLVVTGGGHLGYYDNALYAFNFPTLRWSRMSVPSSLIGFTKGTSATAFADGMPVASHTYDGMVYVPGTGLFELGNCGRDVGGCDGTSYKSVLSALNAAQFGNWTPITSIDVRYDGSSGDQIGVYDPISAKIFLTGSTSSMPLSYLPAPYSGTWTLTTGNVATVSGLETGAIQPGTQLVAVGGTTLQAMDLATANSISTTWSGDSTIPNAGNPGWEWDGDAGKFVGWNGGTTVYTMDPATRVFTAVAAGGATPLCSEAVGPGGCTSTTGVMAQGTWGRFRFLPDYHAFAVVNTIDDHVFGLKPNLGCPSGSPSPNGSTISPATGCSLTESGGNTWQYPGSLSPDGVNYQLNFNGANAGATYTSQQAEATDSGNIFYQKKTTFCGTIWHHRIPSTWGFATAPGTVNTLTADFINTTSGVHYESLNQAVLNLSPSQTITIAASPFSCWPDGAAVTANGATLTFASGTVLSGLIINGKGSLDIIGNNVTVNGGSFGQVAPIRIDNNAQNPTLENLVVHDCSGSARADQFIATSCILSGAGNATVTLTNVEVYHGENVANGGSDHNVYISADVNTDTAATLAITNLYSHDVQNGGWTLKMRPECINTQCHVTNSYIVCTSSLSSGCEQNGIVDIPCGGNYLIDHSTLERGAGGDNGYMVRMLEEPVGVANCAPRATTNNITLDSDILIWDGPSPGWAVTNVVCIAGHDGSGNCALSGVPAGTTCTISNTVIVGDSANGIVPVDGGGCTEVVNVRHYTNRAAAGAAELWAATDRFGNPCCAFPYQPTHP